MPYHMNFLYNSKVSDDSIAVDVYQFSLTGNITPIALCYVTGESTDENAPKKGSWIQVLVTQLQP